MLFLNFRALNDLVDATPKFVEGNRGGLRPLTEILSEQTPVRTLFAPNLFAFNKMRTTQVGREFTRKPNSDKLYYVRIRLFLWQAMNLSMFFLHHTNVLNFVKFFLKYWFEYFKNTF